MKDISKQLRGASLEKREKKAVQTLISERHELHIQSSPNRFVGSTTVELYLGVTLLPGGVLQYWQFSKTRMKCEEVMLFNWLVNSEV